MRFLSLVLVSVLVFTSAVSFADNKKDEDSSLETKVVQYIANGNATYDEANNLIIAIDEDSRSYDAKTERVLQVIEEYAVNHPNDGGLKERVRRFVQQAVIHYTGQTQATPAPGKRSRTLIRLAVASGASVLVIGTGLLYYFLSGDPAPEFILATIGAFPVGWFIGGKLANKISAALGNLKRTMSVEQAQKIVNRLNDFLSNSAVCKVEIGRLAS